MHPVELQTAYIDTRKTYRNVIVPTAVFLKMNPRFWNT